MEYGVKLVFHLPEYCIHGAEVWKCDNYNFRQELIELLGKAGADYFFQYLRRHSFVVMSSHVSTLLSIVWKILFIRISIFFIRWFANITAVLSRSAISMSRMICSYP